MPENLENKIQIEQSDRLTGKQVTKVVQDFARGNTQYVKNQAYYEGKNVNIIKTGNDNVLKRIDPNNVIPLPFARRTINDLQGYAYKPGNVIYNFDTEENNDNDIEVVQEIFKENEEPLTSAEIFQDSAIKGEGAELLYFTDGRIQFAQIPREQCIFEYENTIKSDKLQWAIRFYDVTEVQADGTDLIIHKADVYTDSRVDFYEWIEKLDLYTRNQQLQSDTFTFNFGEDYVYIESELHPFDAVPLHPYRINTDKMGVFQPSISIIDKMDEFGSDSIANAIDQFNDTLLTLSKKVDQATADKIKAMKIIDNLGGKEEGNFAEFLQRNLDIAATLDSTKLFERWYYELTGIPNLNDEKFGVKSGIAIAYALVSFENLVTTMEIYFSKGLQYRLDLINNAALFLNLISQPVVADIDWQRNLPFDIKERSEIAKMLKESGLMSDETILKIFPDIIVSDPAEEIEKRRQEEKEEIAISQEKMQLTINEPRMNVDEDEEN